MSTNKCGSSICYWCIIALGVLLGGALAAIFGTGNAPEINSIFPATAIIGLVFSVVLVFLVRRQKSHKCICRYLNLTFFSSLSLLVLSILSMATTVTPEFVSFIILVFLGSTSLFITVIGLFALVTCMMSCDRNCESDCT